jgi:hypothetical protein
MINWRRRQGKKALATLMRRQGAHARAGVRRRNGTTMAEMPLALWIIIMLCFTLLIFVTNFMRFGFFWNACREAAQQAAKAQTFLNDTVATGPSACTVANTWGALATNCWSGLTLTATNVYIVQTNVITQTTTTYPTRTKLAAAADTTQNIYCIQVELQGQIAPLVPFSTQGFFGNVPGLTGPFPVDVKSQYTAEVPQGLNQ